MSAESRQRQRQARLLSHAALKYSRRPRWVVFYLRAHDRRSARHGSARHQATSASTAVNHGADLKPTRHRSPFTSAAGQPQPRDETPHTRGKRASRPHARRLASRKRMRPALARSRTVASTAAQATGRRRRCRSERRAATISTPPAPPRATGAGHDGSRRCLAGGRHDAVDQAGATVRRLLQSPRRDDRFAARAGTGSTAST
jgi:hypothetical protein